MSQTSPAHRVLVRAGERGPEQSGGHPAHHVRCAPDEELVYVHGGDAWSRSTIEIADPPQLALRKTFVGTRETATFPLDAALEGRRR